MPYYGTIEIIDATGWKKDFPLEKARLSVGSAPFNDLVLSEEHGGGIAPAHLQLFYNPAEPCKLRVVNLDRQPVRIQKTNLTSSMLAEFDELIPGGATGWIEHGSHLVVGDFRLLIRLAATGGITRALRSQSLGLMLELPGKQLRPGNSLEGRLLVTHYGQQPRCQVSLDLDGLPSNCYSIEPVPLLYPGGQEYLRIVLKHRGSQPPAGQCQINLRARAVKDYPTEEVILDVTLDVLPCFGFDLTVSDQIHLPEQKEAVAPVMVPAMVVYETPIQLRGVTEPAEGGPSAEMVISQQSIQAAEEPPMPQAVPVIAESPVPEPAPVIESPPTPPTFQTPDTFISVLAEPGTSVGTSDWSTDVWQSQGAASPRSVSRGGAGRLADLLAGQKVTILKAGSQADLLEESPPPFEEREEEEEG